MENVLHDFKKNCKNILLYSITNISMIWEIIISKLSCILKIMSRNTFSEPQPDIASYPV